MNILFFLIGLALSLFELSLIAYALIAWLKPASNRWTELLKSFLEPVLVPVRKILVEKLPSKYQTFDWSPLVVLLAVIVIRAIIRI